MVQLLLGLDRSRWELHLVSENCPYSNLPQNVADRSKSVAENGTSQAVYRNPSTSATAPGVGENLSTEDCEDGC